MLVVAGVVLALAGLWLWSGRGFGWLGRLPGDISYENGGTRFPKTVFNAFASAITIEVLLKKIFTLLFSLWRVVTGTFFL